MPVSRVGGWHSNPDRLESDARHPLPTLRTATGAKPLSVVKVFMVRARALATGALLKRERSHRCA
jgi:hypothetical protein